MIEVVDGLLPLWALMFVPMFFPGFGQLIGAGIGALGSLFGGGDDGGGEGGGGFDLGGLLGSIAPGAGSLVAALLSGAPEFEDLPPQLQDIVNIQRNANVRGEEFIELQNELSNRNKDVNIGNLRSIGAFDPTSMGDQFSFLQPTVDQFSNVDRSALAQRIRLGDLANINQQNLGLAGQGGTTLGASNQLLQGQGQFAGGIGQGAGGILEAILSNLLRQNEQQSQGGGGGPGGTSFGFQFPGLG